MQYGAIPASKRVENRLPRCSWCGLPLDLCICGDLPRLKTNCAVVLIMHHVEQRRTTNTGRLAMRSLVRGQILIRGLPNQPPREALPEGRRLVLFPYEDAEVLTPEHAKDGPVVLIVPDGNWSQAQRTARRDPDAREATRVTLPSGGEPSRYRLRRNPREGTLSTIEAIGRALAILEGPEVAQELNRVFELFVARSLTLRSSGKPRTPLETSGVTRGDTGS